MIEFRLGRQDHRVVENFLADHPLGVGAISIEAPNLAFQQVAIDAARAAEVDVLVEPLTDRLVDPNFAPKGLTYWDTYPLSIPDFAASDARNSFVDAVMEPQLDSASVFVPPHFFVEDERTLRINLLMARRVLRVYGDDVPVRAILCVKKSFLWQRASEVARRYRGEGITSIDLRLSPLGHQEQGPIAVRRALDVVSAFGREGVVVTLGFQAHVGQAALALGLIASYSVGIGYREQFSQPVVTKPREEGAALFGPKAGVYLPGTDGVVSRRVAQILYSDQSIRSQLTCSLGQCSSAIDMPIRKAPTHYLHSRTALVEELLRRPAPWRANLERERLLRAVAFRSVVNKHIPADATKMKTRLLETLIEELANRQEQANTA